MSCQWSDETEFTFGCVLIEIIEVSFICYINFSKLLNYHHLPIRQSVFLNNECFSEVSSD